MDLSFLFVDDLMTSTHPSGSPVIGRGALIDKMVHLLPHKLLPARRQPLLHAGHHHLPDVHHFSAELLHAVLVDKVLLLLLLLTALLRTSLSVP